MRLLSMLAWVATLVFSMVALVIVSIVGTAGFLVLVQAVHQASPASSNRPLAVAPPAVSIVTTTIIVQAPPPAPQQKMCSCETSDVQIIHATR